MLTWQLCLIERIICDTWIYRWRRSKSKASIYQTAHGNIYIIANNLCCCQLRLPIVSREVRRMPAMNCPMCSCSWSEGGSEVSGNWGANGHPMARVPQRGPVRGSGTFAQALRMMSPYPWLRSWRGAEQSRHQIMPSLPQAPDYYVD